MNRCGPKYIRVYHAMKGDLLSQKYPTGSFLPPEKELMAIYNASMTTIRHAVSLLRDDHLLSVQQGRGTVVLPLPNNTFPQSSKYNDSTQVRMQFLTDGPVQVSYSDAVIDTVSPQTQIQKALGLQDGESVFRIQRLQSVNSIAYCYLVNYLPCFLIPDLQTGTTKLNNLYLFLAEKYGIFCDSADEIISPIVARFTESQMLNVPIDSPLLMIRRTSYCQEHPLEYSEAVIHPELAEFRIQIVPNYLSDEWTPKKKTE